MKDRPRIGEDLHFDSLAHQNLAARLLQETSVDRARHRTKLLFHGLHEENRENVRAVVQVLKSHLH